MSFTGIVFFESEDKSTLLNTAALAGVPYKTNGDDAFVPPSFNQVFMAYAFGDTTISRAQFEAPSMVLKGAHEVKPIDLALEPTSGFMPEKFLETPIVLDEGEAVNAKGQNTGAAADRHIMALWLSDGDLSPVKNPEEISIRATAGITAVADTWSNGQITLDRDLRVGEYALVGARVEGATLSLARFIPSQSNARPMVVCYDTVSDQEDPVFRHGNLGTWCTFKHDAPPAIEVFCSAADTTQVLTLDIVRL